MEERMAKKLDNFLLSWPHGVTVVLPVNVGDSLYFVGIIPEGGIQEIIVKKYTTGARDTFVVPEKHSEYKGPKFMAGLVYAKVLDGPMNFSEFAYFADMDTAKRCYKERFGKDYSITGEV